MSLQAVYRYGGVPGDVVATQEIESDADLPGIDETITLPTRGGGEKRFIVTSRFQPNTVGFEREAAISTYTIVVTDADR